MKWKWSVYDPANPRFGKTYKLVMDLVDGFEEDGYCLYMDRFYAGIQLVADLKEIGIRACEAIRMNRLQLDECAKAIKRV